MSEAAQILLYIVILILAVIFIVLGVQASLILKDLKQTISKANKVLDNQEELTRTLNSHLSNLSGLLSGLRTGVSFLNVINKVTGDKEKKDE